MEQLYLFHAANLEIPFFAFFILSVSVGLTLGIRLSRSNLPSSRGLELTHGLVPRPEPSRVPYEYYARKYTYYTHISHRDIAPLSHRNATKRKLNWKKITNEVFFLRNASFSCFLFFFVLQFSLSLFHFVFINVYNEPYIFSVHFYTKLIITISYFPLSKFQHFSRIFSFTSIQRSPLIPSNY